MRLRSIVDDANRLLARRQGRFDPESEVDQVDRRCGSGGAVRFSWRRACLTNDHRRHFATSKVRIPAGVLDGADQHVAAGFQVLRDSGRVTGRGPTRTSEPRHPFGAC